MLKNKRISAIFLAAVLSASVMLSQAAVLADDTAAPAGMPSGMPGGGMGGMGGPMGDTDGEPPELPDGAEQGERPEMPDGAEEGEEPPEKPDGEMPAGEAPSESTAVFTDVQSGAWYYNAVMSAYQMGFISGKSDTTFAPTDTVTGAELLSMLYRADGNSSDAESTNWYDSAVAWAQENSLITGDWTFEPTTALTREQMMVIVYRFMLYKGESTDADSSLSSFGDTSAISSYAQDAVNWMVYKGYVSGSDGNINPQNSLTRAEIAVILVNCLGGGMNNVSGDQMTPPDGEAPSGMGGGQTPDGMGGGASGGFGGSGEVTQGTAATEITEDGDYSDTSYSSTGDDENALRVTGAAVTLDGITVNKSAGSSSNTEDGDFYGQNAALLATDGADVTITNSTITSSAQNGNGVFSYGEGTVVTISDSTITTSADNSGGIQTTGGGTTYANDLTVNTSGSSAAAIRSDRGGGTVVVDGGSYTSNGYNSPAVYSTADITVSNADLTANNSEALVIEGQNSIAIENCNVYGNMSDTKGTSSDTNVHNIMIYQSMSGDAEVGTSEFDAEGGSIICNNGDMIYVTNTHCIIKLSDVDLTNNDSEGYFLRAAGNDASHGWGSAGSNGAQVELTADDQTIEGNILVDTISTLSLSLKNGSYLKGTIDIAENEDGGTAVDDNVDVVIDSDSTWVLTGDCTVTTLTNNGTIDFNGYTITLADGTILS